MSLKKKYKLEDKLLLSAMDRKIIQNLRGIIKMYDKKTDEDKTTTSEEWEKSSTEPKSHKRNYADCFTRTNTRKYVQKKSYKRPSSSHNSDPLQYFSDKKPRIKDKQLEKKESDDSFSSLELIASFLNYGAQLGILHNYHDRYVLSRRCRHFFSRIEEKEKRKKFQNIKRLKRSSRSGSNSSKPFRKDSFQTISRGGSDPTTVTTSSSDCGIFRKCRSLIRSRSCNESFQNNNHKHDKHCQCNLSENRKPKLSHRHRSKTPFQAKLSQWSWFCNNEESTSNTSSVKAHNGSERREDYPSKRVTWATDYYNSNKNLYERKVDEVKHHKNKTRFNNL